jgi:hypothetical protein
VNVQKLRVRVNVHGQVDVAVPHRGLSRPRRYPAFAQVSPKRGAEGVNVERPAPVVHFNNSRQLQVPVEDANQLGRDGENRHVRRQAGWDRLPEFLGLPLESFERLGEPLPEIGCQVGTDRDGVALPTLFVGGLQLGESVRAIEA